MNEELGIMNEELLKNIYFPSSPCPPIPPSPHPLVPLSPIPKVSQ